ncbi:MAG: transporter [Cyanobacteria bacterium P01_C01_bin.73]
MIHCAAALSVMLSAVAASETRAQAQAEPTDSLTVEDSIVITDAEALLPVAPDVATDGVPSRNTPQADRNSASLVYGQVELAFEARPTTNGLTASDSATPGGRDPILELSVAQNPAPYQFGYGSLPLLANGNHTPTNGDTLLWSPSRPDSHAPIGVMSDHTHEQGELMLSYRYMFMNMDGNRSSTTSQSPAEVLQQFPVTPTRMTMQMHMFGAMYAPTDDLTLMAMVPYIIKEMDHITRMGVEFTTNSEGFGDIGLSGLYTVLNQNRQRIHLNLGLSFPTGSIEERDATPMGPNQILPYPMQIGSGTFDLRPGVTYLGQAGDWSWGAQAMGTIRLGINANGYSLGDQLMLTAWGARQWTNWFSTSVRLGGQTWGNIDGRDSRLNPNMIPTANPDLRAGTQLDVGLGLNFYVPEGGLSGTRLAVEFNLPIYRSLSGPQLETDYSITAGLQATF